MRRPKIKVCNICGHVDNDDLTMYELDRKDKNRDKFLYECEICHNDGMHHVKNKEFRDYIKYFKKETEHIKQISSMEFILIHVFKSFEQWKEKNIIK